jgi:hypothetical protein
MAPFTTYDATVPVIFSTLDVYGNAITLYEGTWTSHIITEHTPMIGLENHVAAAIQEPDEINPSTRFQDSFGFRYENAAFANISTSNDIRVFVQYADPKSVLSGGTSGLITTAYPIDLARYNPKLGAAIYKKPKS